MFTTLAEQANANAALLNRGRRLTIDILAGIGADDFLISIEKGRVVDVRPRRLAMESGVFTVRAPVEAWTEHWRSMPARDFHDLLSMIAAGHVVVDGDLTQLLQNLLYFKLLFAAPRGSVAVPVAQNSVGLPGPAPSGGPVYE
ncbi:MAG: hypothetical protein P8M79_13400, partial [Alphaproteobacteria bacterium]|nr:hypothetical protein [Alphaproteobacteria bacterium]